jgi:hypothetical protein
VNCINKKFLINYMGSKLKEERAKRGKVKESLHSGRKRGEAGKWGNT